MQYSYGTVTAPAFLSETADLAAPQLLGWRVVSDSSGAHTELVLTEVEAYRSDDPASHSFGGPRGRNVVMFERPGLLYVYRSYGIHWCANVVCAVDGIGAAVLLRAIEPTHGLETMRARRALDDIRVLAAGPGRLTQSLGITDAHDCLDVRKPPFALRAPLARPEVVESPRVGITRATELLWRYSLAGSSFVSRPRPRP